MRSLFFVVAATAVVLAQPAAPLVVVPSSAAGGALQDVRARAEPRPKPGSDSIAPGTSIRDLTFAGFLAPEEVAQIRVEHYNAQQGKWGAQEPWTDASLQRELRALLTARAEGMWSRILWSEGNVWSIDATVVFTSGRKGRVLADGLHVCYEDPDGYRWFFRVH